MSAGPKSSISPVGGRTRSRITTGGQISVPASIRRRWQTNAVTIEDNGDAMVVRPLPADPVAALIGSVTPVGGLSADEIRELYRDEEEMAEERRWQDR